MKRRILVSIIIVNYKVEKSLYICLGSIPAYFAGIDYEVIVVENDPQTNLSSELKKYQFVKYIRAKQNRGFGAGNNLGAQYANGEFVFFLNPDTKIEKGNITSLLELFKDKKTGVVAPLLLDHRKKPYVKQGTLRLTPLSALFSLSFISKYFPNNSIAAKYWLKGWNKKTVKEVDVVPGTAFIIRKKLFEKMHGFDEIFFLYFEENDLCDRISNKGFKNYISPDFQIIHEWGKSTATRPDIQKIFNESRKYYLVKHYGGIGYIVNLLLSSELGKRVKTGLFLTLILEIAFFLRIYRLNQVMQFIADQGWFYLSARDMLLTGVIPLVGNFTSHPWLHHGPLWTYMLALLLFIFHFNPIIPAYFIAVLGTITVGVVFITVSKAFSLKIGILAALLYATSPFIVMNSRMPYHTSPIPFFVTLLFLLTYLWIKGNKFALPGIALLLSILYNHEITTFVFDVAVGIIFIYGLIRKKQWVLTSLELKIFLVSLLLFTIPMIPFILYDTKHGYHQTIGFIVWVMYRIVRLPLGIISSQFISSGSNPSSLPEFFNHLTQLIFMPSKFISGLVGALSVLYAIVYVIKKRFFHISPSFGILILFLSIGILGLFVHRVPIEADLLLVAPFIIILMSLSVLWLCRQKFIVALVAVVVISAANAYFLLSTDFLTKMSSQSRFTYLQRVQAVEETIQLSGNKPYNIVGKGELSNLPVFLDSYQYLLWYKGKPVSSKSEKTKIQIWEKGNKIIVTKK